MEETATVAARPRRTQAERREATRAALLDATVASLVESGYASVTSAEIASRAGVTRGASAHHFTNKAALVTEAVRHLAQTLIDNYAAQFSLSKRPIADVLDALWDMHQSTTFVAAAELWMAARTDAELRASLTALEHDVTSALAMGVESVIPADEPKREVYQLTSTTLATMRGLAMLRFVRDDVDPEWRAARGHLLELWNVALDS